MCKLTDVQIKNSAGNLIIVDLELGMSDARTIQREHILKKKVFANQKLLTEKKPHN